MIPRHVPAKLTARARDEWCLSAFEDKGSEMPERVAFWYARAPVSATGAKRRLSGLCRTQVGVQIECLPGGGLVRSLDIAVANA